MKLPASDKTSSFGRRPHIKKGYYPAQLLKVEPFRDRDGNLREGKYGRQLIFDFAIYKPDSETGKPIEPIKAKNENGELVPVVISKFVYHEYRVKDQNTNKWIEGQFQTAITPNSAITKLLKILGWEFSKEGVDIDPLIGKWVEANIDDYEQSTPEETYIASTIKDINQYKGPEIDEKLEKVEPPKEPKKINKQIKHEATKDNDAEKEEKKRKLKELLDEGTLTQKAYNQAIEQVEAGR